MGKALILLFPLLATSNKKFYMVESDTAADKQGHINGVGNEENMSSSIHSPHQHGEHLKKLEQKTQINMEGEDPINNLDYVDEDPVDAKNKIDYGIFDGSFDPW